MEEGGQREEGEDRRDLAMEETNERIKEEKMEQPEAATANDTVEEEPAISETVDIIKNDNNVVVFFCKYSTENCRWCDVMRFSSLIFSKQGRSGKHKNCNIA